MSILIRIFRLTLVLLNLSAVVLVFVTLIFSLSWGFDFTDEAFYIQNAWFPYENLGSLTLFGYYLNILVPLFGRDVFALRAFGLFGLVIASLFFAFHFVLYSRNHLRFQQTRPELIAQSSGTVAAALVYYNFWLITPSYNWFSLIGAMLVAGTGLWALRVGREDGGARLPVRSALLIGITLSFGGFIGFVGRPTTALGLGTVAGLWLILSLPLRSLWLIGSVAVSTFAVLLVAQLLWLPNGWTDVVIRVEIGQSLGATLQAGHTLSSVFARAGQALMEIPNGFFRLPILTGYTAVVIGTGLALAYEKLTRPSDRPRQNGIAVFAIVVGYAAFLLVWWYRTRSVDTFLPVGQFGVDMVLFTWGLLFLSLVQSGFFSVKGLSSSCRAAVRSVYDGRRSLGLISVLALFALAAPVGSSSSIVKGSHFSYVFYAAAAMLATMEAIGERHRLARLLCLTLITGVSAYFVMWGAFHPYRQPGDLFSPSAPVTFLDSATVLKVPPTTARWINGLQEVAIASGWRAGTPLIDLTGGTPGAAVVLAGRPPTTPWLVGGYKGSRSYVETALSLAGEETLQEAWILTAPEGVRQVPAQVLEAAGLQFPQEYTLVGKVRTGYRDEEQFLWKPK